LNLRRRRIKKKLAASADTAQTEKKLVPAKTKSAADGSHDNENSSAEQKIISDSEFGKY